MARPIKKGLDFFPLDVHLEDDIELIEAEYGLEGFAILIKLWQKIYANGYYIEWTEDNALLFARRINSDITIVNSIVNSCLIRSIFNESIYNKHKILTSSGIQKRYFKIVVDSKRTQLTAIKDYFLLTPELTPINLELTRLIPVNLEESTQSKVDKSIVNKNKEKESIEDNKYYVEITNFLNDRLGTKYKSSSEKTKSLIDARIKQGFTVDDFKIVIDKKSNEWIGTEQEKFLRPETLFGNKFEGYLNQKIVSNKLNTSGTHEAYHKFLENDEEINLL